jgi:3-keto-5-aminohexanoate cleavage enzyme
MGEHVFLNLPEFLETLAKETLARGIKPELEVFEVGMVYTCLRYLEKGLLQNHSSISQRLYLRAQPGQ